MAKTNAMLQDEKEKKVAAISANQKDLHALDEDLSLLMEEKRTNADTIESGLRRRYEKYLKEHPIDRSQEPEITEFVSNMVAAFEIVRKNFQSYCDDQTAAMRRIPVSSMRDSRLTPYKGLLRDAVKNYVVNLKDELDEIFSATEHFYKNGISKDNMQKLLDLMDDIWFEGNDILITVNGANVAKGSLPSRYAQKIGKWKFVSVPEDIEAEDNERIKNAAQDAKAQLIAVKSNASGIEKELQSIDSELTRQKAQFAKLKSELENARENYQSEKDTIIENSMTRLQKLSDANKELVQRQTDLSNDLEAMRLDRYNTFFLFISKRKTLKNLINSTEAEIADVNNKTQALYIALDDEKRTCHRQLESLDDNIAELEHKIKETDTNIAFLLSKRATTKKTLVRVNQQIPSLQRAVEDARADYLVQAYGDKKILSRIDAKQKKIDDLTETISDLEMDVEAIELKIQTASDASTDQDKTRGFFKRNKLAKESDSQEPEPVIDERISEIDGFEFPEIPDTVRGANLLATSGNHRRLPTWGKPFIAGVAVFCILQSVLIAHIVKGGNADTLPDQSSGVVDSTYLSASTESIYESDEDSYVSGLDEVLTDDDSDHIEEASSIDTQSTQVGSSENTVDYTWPNGISYTGGYKNGEANGYGEMTFPDEGIYKGNFLNGKRSGFGSFSWINGDNYSGNWTDDAMDGQGTYTFADGYTMEGIWSQNQFIGKTDGVLSLEEPVEQIQINYGDYVLELNDSITLEATVSPDTATYQSLTWASSDPSVANVTSSGVVTAYSVGETIISVTADNGVTASCYIKVYHEIVSIWDGIWSIATTDAAGSYEGTNYGTCTISTDSMTVTVSDGAPISLTASGESTLTGTTTSGAYTGELCYTSLTEYNILLEINWVYTAIGYDDVVTTYYFLLTRVEG